jgi:two-component system NarL family sensor kinase
VCQLLVSIKYQFETAAHRLAHPSGQPVTTIDKEINALSQAITEVRQISHNLRPALLDDLGLPSALEQIGHELAARTGLKVNVVARAVDEALPEPQSVDLFRVTQEALRNIAQHAKATHVDIHLERRRDQIALRITDDGCGFDVQRLELSKDRGIGLSNMRERLERNGGVFRVRSEPGCTCVTAMFPLTAPERRERNG